MDKKTLCSILFLCMAVTAAQAGEKKEEKPSRQYNTVEFRNEVRIGIGDNGFEKTFFGNSVHMSYVDRPESATYLEKQNHKYVPHVFAEYDYNLLPWLSLGGQIDFSGFSWDNQYYRGGSDTIVKSEEQNCYNIVIQGICRFNWLRRKHFMLYSGIGLGMDINTGTEVDPYGKKTIPGIAVSPILLGLRGGAGHWFGALEFGGINALKDPSQLLLVGARTLSLSAGYKF